MGAGWSENGAPTPVTEPCTRVSHSLDIPKPVEEHTKPHSSGCDVKAKAPEPKLPHNYEAILKDADNPIDRSSTNKLYEQLHCGVFLSQKRKKYWVERNTLYNSFMVFARDLSITWGEDNRYWHWPNLKETTEEFIDVAEVLNVCWLEVHGKFNTANLSPGLTYEVVFVVMLKDPAYGWEIPVNVRLLLPDGSMQEHKKNLLEKPRGRWIELHVGEFHTSVDKFGELQFSLFEYEGGKWKRGLVIKGVTIRPKN